MLTPSIFTKPGAKLAPANWSNFRLSHSSNSIIAIVLLGLVASMPFAYMFWREWWLQRCFRRFCENEKRKRGLDNGAAGASGPRAPLIKDSQAKRASAEPTPAPVNGAHSHNRQASRTQPLQVPQWVAIPQTHAAGLTVPFAGQPNQRNGIVHVQADEKDSEVFVDNAFVGNPPAVLSLAEGAHVVEIKRAGYEDYCRELNIFPGAELNVRAVLKKLEPDGAVGGRANLPGV